MYVNTLTDHSGFHWRTRTYPEFTEATQPNVMCANGKHCDQVHNMLQQQQQMEEEVPIFLSVM